MDQPGAGELLQRVLAKYEGLPRYADSGEVRTFDEDSKKPRSELRFETRWARPDRFWFRFWSRVSSWDKAPIDVYTVWQMGPVVRSCWTAENGQRRSHQTLSMALAGPTGISRGAAVCIPSLLDPDEVKVGRSLREMIPSEPVRVELIDGVAHWWITGGFEGDGVERVSNYPHPHGGKRVLRSRNFPGRVLIGPDLLIRSVEETYELNGVRTRDCFTVRPNEHPVFAEADFEFTPE